VICTKENLEKKEDAYFDCFSARHDLVLLSFSFSAVAVRRTWSTAGWAMYRFLGLLFCEVYGNDVRK
jgi:hypothetical protein